MLLKELWAEDLVTPEEMSIINKKHIDRLRAFWETTHRAGIDENRLRAAAKISADREINKLAHVRAKEQGLDQPSQNQSELPPENLKPGERFPQWKISPDGWGGD